jgi:hypothetical protein
MSKGSRPRPYSVGQKEFGNNYDVIFRKKDMQVRVKENNSDVGNCGCGRSPTGKCIGWHGLTEEMYQHRKFIWMEEEFRRDYEVKDSTQGG